MLSPGLVLGDSEADPNYDMMGPGQMIPPGQMMQPGQMMSPGQMMPPGSMMAPGQVPASTLPAQAPPQTSQCGLVDKCCGMAHEGCCQGGQQCYTYYENVCENVNQPRCRMKGREFCDEAIMPDCRIEKTRGSMVGTPSITQKYLAFFPANQPGSVHT